MVIFKHDNDLRRKIRLSREGFSLVEVIVASVLLALITAGILSVSLSSRNIIKRSHLRHDGYQVAEAVIENIRKELGQDKWIDPTNPIYPSGQHCYNLSAGDSLGVYAAYGTTEFANRHKGKWCYQVENPSDCPGGACDYRKITVNVTWEEDRPQ